MGLIHPPEGSTVNRLSPASALDTYSPNQQLLPLTAQVNHQDNLEIGGCDLTELVQQFGSPLYILDETTLRVACRQYRQAFQRYYPGESEILYASKAWSCLAVCAIAASEGLGIDVMSAGELYTALKAGVNPRQIYFHGNNKSRQELQLAIESGCTVVADNWLELQILVELTQETGQMHRKVSDGQVMSSGQAAPTNLPPQPPQPRPRVMLRITPGIECHTHEYIRTGHLDSKFGFDPTQLVDVFTFASQHPSIHWVGIHAHIGSQVFELQPHRDLTGVIVDWLIKAADFGLSMDELNVGGGLGIRYVESDDPPSIETWAKAVCEGMLAACQARHISLPKLLCEPGRSVIGSACVTAYTLGSTKVIPDRTYLAVDGGMSDNPRPITYQSTYRAVVANRMLASATETVAIAGKHCESGDILLKEAQLPRTQPGDILVIMDTGAYNYSMASNYNRLPRPAAVLVKAGEANIFLERETYQDLIRHDRLPDRLVTNPNVN